MEHGSPQVVKGTTGMKNKDGKLTSIVGKDAVVGGNFSTPGSARIDGVIAVSYTHLTLPTNSRV